MNVAGSIRLESIRVIVDQMLLKLTDADKRRDAYVTLYGVSSFAAMLAAKRGLDHELAAIAGLLHDYYFFLTGVQTFRDQNSAEAVRPILKNVGIFTREEQITILRAIFYHTDRHRVHDVYDELIKDAVILQQYYYNPSQKVRHTDAARLTNTLFELSIPGDFEMEQQNDDWNEVSTSENKRTHVADIAEELASKGIVGIPGDHDYRHICAHWPDDNIYKVLKDGWCAAFVFFCCREAGFMLPIRYPNGICRFAGVAAWLEWAKLPELQFFHDVNERNYSPEKGDIVIYEKLITDESHDHIGIVLSCNEKELLVAEGNMDNKNKSGLVRRDKWDKVLGFIRIHDDYCYSFSGEYNPI